MARSPESSSSDQADRYPTTETTDNPNDRLCSEADRTQHAGTADSGRFSDFAGMSETGRDKLLALVRRQVYALKEEIRHPPEVFKSGDSMAVYR